MRQGSLLLLSAVLLCAQDGQQGTPAGWPCVAGRAIDPAYLETSESTGGQIFLFQKDEVQHSSVVMTSSYSHPSTILRAVGHLSGARDFQFPVDSTVESVLVMVSLQCRKEVAVLRPNGQEMTAANSAQSVDLKAGRIVRVDHPEPGQWQVRISGTGLFVVSVLAKSPIKLTDVRFATREPKLGTRQDVEVTLPGEVSHVKLQLVGPSVESLTTAEAPEALGGSAFRLALTPAAERFRILMTATDANGWPVERMYPNLFRAKP